MNLTSFSHGTNAFLYTSSCNIVVQPHERDIMKTVIHQALTFLIVTVLALPSLRAQQTFYTIPSCTSGCDLTNFNNWSSSPNGSNANPSNWNKLYIVQAGHEGFIPATTIWSGSGNLEIHGTVVNNYLMYFSGSSTLYAGGRYVHNTMFNVFPTTINDSSTVVIAPSANLLTNYNFVNTIDHLEIQGNRGTVTSPLGYTGDLVWSNALATMETGSVPEDMIIEDSSTVVLSADKVINANVIVEAGSVLELADSISLTISGNIENYGEVIIGDQSNFVQTGATDNNINVGTYSVRRVFSASRDDFYNYWSFPVSDETVGDVFPNSNQRYTHNGGWAAASGGDTLTPGWGLATTADAGTNSLTTFTKEFNGHNILNGPITIGGFNDIDGLIGNPYPSVLRGDSLLSQNSHIDVLYFWNHITPADTSGNSPNDYATFTLLGGAAAVNGGATPNGNIASCQGVMIEMSSAAPIEFTNNMRSSNSNNQFFSQVSGLTKAWLSVLSPSDQGGEILFGFGPNFSDGYDNQWDGRKILGSGPINFSSQGPGEIYAVQARPALSFLQPNVIPLGLETQETGQHTVKLTGSQMIPDNMGGYIFDRQTHSYYPLKNEVAEIEILQSGSFTDRFFLVIQPLEMDLYPTTIVGDLAGSAQTATGVEEYINATKIYNAMGTVVISNQEVFPNGTNVIIHNMAGQLIYQNNISGQQSITIPQNELASSGALLISIQTESYRKTRTLVMK